MNSKAFQIIKNLSYTFTSNLVALLVSTLIILIVPKLIGINSYGYWQLYIFYTSYIGFMHLGWNDGIYLRYGGYKYIELDKKLFFSQFYMLLILQMFFTSILIIYSVLNISEPNRRFILISTAVTLLLSNTRYFLFYVLQSTNRVSDYAKVTIIDRTIYITIICAMLINGYREFKLLILADIFAKFLSLIIASIYCKDIVYKKVTSFIFTFQEAFENIRVGIKLMFSNIGNMLIIGIIRFGIERAWNVGTFGKVSLVLSISNAIMLFINTVGIVFFPILKRSDESKLPNLYITMRSILVILLLSFLLLYYPIKIALLFWLPKYADSIIYMSLVFPMVVFEGKMTLLVNTYMKTLRKEKLLLKLNISFVLLSLLFTIFFTILFKNLNLAVLSILIILGLRSIMAEVLLSKILGISVTKDIIIELAITIIFVIVSWFINSWVSFFLFFISYLIYMIIKSSEIKYAILVIKPMFIKTNNSN